MKKIVVMLVVLIVTVPVVFAQVGSSVFGGDQDAHWAVGPKTGVGFNWAANTLGNPSAGLLPKAYVGVFGEYAFNRYIAIQSDFMVGIHHGFKRQDYQLVWTTMDFDILLKGRLPFAKFFVATFGAGLALSTGVGSLTEKNEGYINLVNFADYALNAVGIGIALELGLEYNLPNNVGYVGTSLRMDWKLNPHYKPISYVEVVRRKGAVHTPIGIMLFYGYRWQRSRVGAFR